MIRRPSIILFGDSITQLGYGSIDGGTGWVSLLSSAYSRRADILNRGFSGYNTRQALDILPRVFPTKCENLGSHSVAFCTVFFGANDAALPGERQHVPLEEYRENLIKIISSIRKNVGAGSNRITIPIILITPPPVNSDQWDSYCMDNFKSKSLRSNESAWNYRNVVKDVGTETDCYVFDAFASLGGSGKVNDYKRFLSDGLHLSEVGNKALFEGLLSVIKKNIPHLYPDDDKGLKLEEKPWDALC